MHVVLVVYGATQLEETEDRVDLARRFAYDWYNVVWGEPRSKQALDCCSLDSVRHSSDIAGDL